MTGWLVNDKLATIPGTRTFWHHLLDAVPGLVPMTSPDGQFDNLASFVESRASIECPNYIIRNGCYFRALSVMCPVISLIQDIIGYSHTKAGRDAVIESSLKSRLTVFNSEYTREAYPELHAADYKIIPIGTDESIFFPTEPDADIPDGAVLWVGSGHPVKGFDLACYLASESNRPWVFVMKDDAEVPVDGAIVYRSITQEKLAAVASACAVGVCTSNQETQHLAGIEMGMCGVPLVATNVGVYNGREPGPWGETVNGDWLETIERASGLDGYQAARYWRDEGFGLSNSMSMWNTVVESLGELHVVR